MDQLPVILPASRRKLERDMEGLLDQHGVYAILHALVELCHSAIRKATSNPRRFHLTRLRAEAPADLRR